VNGDTVASAASRPLSQRLCLSVCQSGWETASELERAPAFGWALGYG